MEPNRETLKRMLQSYYRIITNRLQKWVTQREKLRMIGLEDGQVRGLLRFARNDETTEMTTKAKVLKL